MIEIFANHNDILEHKLYLKLGSRVLKRQCIIGGFQIPEACTNRLLSAPRE